MSLKLVLGSDIIFWLSSGWLELNLCTVFRSQADLGGDSDTVTKHNTATKISIQIFYKGLTFMESL